MEGANYGARGGNAARETNCQRGTHSNVAFLHAAKTGGSDSTVAGADNKFRTAKVGVEGLELVLGN